MEKRIDVVVLAGDRTASQPVYGKNKAFLEIHGLPLFLHTVNALQQAKTIRNIHVVGPLDRLEEETVSWCRDILANSPMAIRLLKSCLNADCDGQAGLQVLAGDATLLFYLSEEAKEGRNAFVEGRQPDFSRFPRLP